MSCGDRHDGSRKVISSVLEACRAVTTCTIGSASSVDLLVLGLACLASDGAAIRKQRGADHEDRNEQV